MKQVPIPPCPHPTDALITPQEVDLSPLVIASGSTQHALHQQDFIDLTAHPEYPKATRSLLPASDRIVILPAYTKLYERACYLNERYKAFVPGGEQGHQSPPHHFSTGAASHKIFFALLDEERLFSQHYELKIETKYLQDLLCQEISATRKAQQRAFYHRLLEVPSLKDAAGRIFEQATHQLFKKGGRFRLGRILEASFFKFLF